MHEARVSSGSSIPLEGVLAPAVNCYRQSIMVCDIIYKYATISTSVVEAALRAQPPGGEQRVVGINARGRNTESHTEAAVLGDVLLLAFVLAFGFMIPARSDAERGEARRCEDDR
jgi:hypothetical protein